MAYEYDDLVKILGKSGRFEMLLVAILAFHSLFAAYLNLGIVFVAGIPEHWCNVPDLDKFNLTQEQIRSLSTPPQADTYSRCLMYDRNYSSWTEADVAAALGATVNQTLSAVKCRYGWHYDQSQYQSTIVSEWDLVCDRQWMRATIIAVFAAGCAVGGPFFGALSDILGRRVSIYIAATLKCASAMGLAFAPNYSTFLCLRFFLALSNYANYLASWILTVEIVAPSKRVHASVVFSYFWSIGYMAFAGISYAIRDWFTLQLVSSATTLLVFTYLWFIPESPRWLYTKNKPEKADNIMRKIAKFNKVQLPEKLDVAIQPVSKGRAWDVFRTPRLRCRSINLFFIWFVIVLVYYGLSLNTSNLGGNDYLNFFIAGAVEVPAYVFCHVVMTYIGRRWPLSGTMLLGGVLLVAIVVVPAGMTWLVISLAMIGKFCITASFKIVYIVTAEVYPTSIRNVALGTCALSSRIGGVIAPFIAELGTTNRVIPPVIFGVMSITAGLLALLLPETKDQHLPDTLKDGEEFQKDFHPCGSCFSSDAHVEDDRVVAKKQGPISGIEADGEDTVRDGVEKPMLDDTVV